MNPDISEIIKVSLRIVKYISRTYNKYIIGNFNNLIINLEVGIYLRLNY